MKKWRGTVSIFVWGLLLVLIMAQPVFARTQITFWTRWTGDEFNVLKQIVDNFNASQDEITVKLLSVSDLDTKFYTAVAAGNAPDVVHVMSHQVPSWAAKNALLPLNDIASYGVDFSKYVERYLNLGKYKDNLYALPTTPGIVVLYWNKALFREAGLDPDEPPKTIEELNEYIRKLTKYDSKGNIVQLGFDPLTPGWWPAAWCYFFGGKLYDPATNKITANAPENVKAFEWLRDFTKEYGLEKLLKFRASFGQYWSAENPFVSGKVAMSFDGIWKAHLIDIFAPNLEWGVAAFPSADGKKRVYIEGDCVGISANAKHPEAAKKFIAYLEKPENLEYLNLKQWKIPPLKGVSESFYAENPNKRARDFIEIVNTADELFYWPRIAVWNYYGDQWWNTAIPKVTLLKTPPQVALDLVQKNTEREFKRYK